MKLRRIMIAAPKSGSGKTTVTCGLLQALKEKNQKVIAYKCGPDYIDPMFHQKVIDIPSKNLDTFFTEEEKTKQIFLKDRNENDFAIMEGVMGLFDGLGGIRDEGSSYHLAKVTKTPIILVIDAKGMGRSVIALIAGFLAYDTEKLIQGVILNRVSKGYFDIIKPFIEKELSIKAVGYLPDIKELQMPGRHLGLVMPDELAEIKEQLHKISMELQKTVSLERIVEIAEKAEEITVEACPVIQKKEGPVIAVAKDEAFCFYYEDNLSLLEEYGANIVYFSPVHDAELPEDCSGILLGGGYPELYLEELSQNESMLNALRKKIKDGIPVVAECGGFMYLHEEIRRQDNTSCKMVGAIQATCYDTGKLVRFGYIEVTEHANHFLPENETIRGHEFHYFESERNGEDCLATRPVTGKSYPCIISGANYWFGFPHLYYPSNPDFARRFVEMAREFAD